MKSFLSHSSILVVLLLIGRPVCGQSDAEPSGYVQIGQSIQVSTDTEIGFKIVASAKAELIDDWSSAAVYAFVQNKDGEPGFFDNMGDRPIILNEWDVYTIEGTINENAEEIGFGIGCIGNGKFYFDNVEVFTEKPDGTFEKVEIRNGGFEMEMNPEGPNGWIDGTGVNKSVKGKEYTFSHSNDKIDGDFALLIEGVGAENPMPPPIGPIEGYSPLVGTLISMLNNLSDRVESRMGNLDQRELDHLLDEKANSIGALIMHLVATEVYYQKRTFGDIEYDEADSEKWETAMSLGQKGRETLHSHDAKYYFDTWKMVRNKTLEEFKKRDDSWLALPIKGSGMTNHLAWFHVMEHQSSHLGQMLLLRKRIPEPPENLELEVN